MMNTPDFTTHGRTDDRRSYRPHPRTRRAGAFGAVMLAAALAFAGCGVTATPTSGSGTAQSAASATATATATIGKHIPPTGGTAAPCPAGLGTPPASMANQVVLTTNTPAHTVNVTTGQQVVVQLSARMRWSFSGVSGASGSLTVVQPSGVLENTAAVCIWTFQAATPGTATLTFAGKPICAQGEVCPQYVISQDFTVQVS